MANKAAKLEIQVDAETKSAIKDLDKVAAAVDDISESAADAGSALDSIASGAAGAAEAAGDSFGGIVPVFDVSAVLGAVGDLASKAGEFFSSKMSDAMDLEVGRDKLQGQLGATGEEAARLGKLAGEVYSEAFGESMEQVNDAIRRIVQNLGMDAFDPVLKSLTSGILDVVNVFDQDMQKTTQALGNLVKTGLVKDATEGLDLIVRGFQEGADNADDFMDSLIEFSTDFRQAGLTGAQSVGLMIQALKNGARDTDKLSDALAEWRKKGVDGSKAVADAYKDLGLDVKDIARDIGRGGSDAADALKRTFDAIRNLEDPGEKLRLIAETFGTPAEDLAQAFTNIDLSKAVDELGTVKDAATNLSKTVGDNAATTWESFKRSIQTNVVEFLANNVVPAFQNLGEKAKGVMADMGRTWDVFVSGFTGQPVVSLGVDAGKLTSSISAIEGMQPPTEGNFLQTVRDFGEETRRLSDEWLPKLKDAFIALNTEVEKTLKFLRENKDLMDILAIVAIAGLIGALIVLIAILGLVAAGLGVMAAGLVLLGAPVALVMEILRRLGVTWDEVWGAMLITIETVGGQIGRAITLIVDTVKGLIGVVWGLFNMDGGWSDSWESAKAIVESAKKFILDSVGAISDAITDLIDLFRGVPTMGTGNITMPRSVAPSSMGPTAFATSTAGRAAPVFNVTVQHSGLAVDSPRLQREIVDALRRWQKREGPLRGMMGN